MPVSVEGETDEVLALIGCDVLDVSDEERVERVERVEGAVVGRVFQKEIVAGMKIIMY